MNETNEKLDAREQFERYVTEAETWSPGSLSKTDGEYDDLTTHSAWTLWEAGWTTALALSESQASEPHTEVTASVRELARKIQTAEWDEDRQGYFQLNLYQAGSLLLAFAKQYAERERTLLRKVRLWVGAAECHRTCDLMVSAADNVQCTCGRLAIYAEFQDLDSEPVGVLLDVEKALQEATREMRIKPSQFGDYIAVTGEHSDVGEVEVGIGWVDDPGTPECYWSPNLAAYLRAQQAPKGGTADV